MTEAQLWIGALAPALLAAGLGFWLYRRAVGEIEAARARPRIGSLSAHVGSISDITASLTALDAAELALQERISLASGKPATPEATAEVIHLTAHLAAIQEQKARKKSAASPEAMAS